MLLPPQSTVQHALVLLSCLVVLAPATASPPARRGQARVPFAGARAAPSVDHSGQVFGPRKAPDRRSIFWYVPEPARTPGGLHNETDYVAAISVVRENSQLIDAVIMMCELQVLPSGTIAVGGQGGSYDACQRGSVDLPNMGVEMWALTPAISNLTLFRAVAAPDRVGTLVSSLAKLVRTLSLKGINIDWEIGPATARDRELMTHFLQLAKSTLRPLDCQLTLHSGGYHGGGDRQLNHVQPAYVPALDLVTDGTLYRATNISDWVASLEVGLNVVPAQKLAVAFCPPGCKKNWSATESSVDERFSTLRASYPLITHLAVWRLQPELGWPQAWYWPHLRAWKGLIKTDDDPIRPPDYQLYQPTIAHSTVVSPLTSPLQYNHDASIALFKSVWIAVWNANTNYKEGQPGQFNMMSSSADLNNWTVPVHAFSDPQWSINPVPCDLNTCEQWQPNLFMLANGHLGCVWSGSNGRDGRSDGNTMVTYFSSLSSPGDKWTNHAITFASGDGRTKPFFPNWRGVGANWTLFASQNPTTLASGRILAPVVMTSSLMAKDADRGCKQLHPPHNVSQMCFERRSSVLISDDHGAHWHESQGTVIPSATWAQWEPTVWPAGNGSTGAVSMISRFNDFNLPPSGPVADRRMQRASSTDFGETWSSLRPLPLDTVVSRMQVTQQLGTSPNAASSLVRNLMVMNDINPLGIRGTEGRQNVALYLSPVGAPVASNFAFAPGPGISAPHEVAMYPQMWQDGGRLAVIWSSGSEPRGIRVASLPLPADGTKMLMIRNNTSFQAARPQIEQGKWLVFNGEQRLQTAAPLRLSPLSRAFSIGGWLSIDPLAIGGSGTVLDSRGLPKGGFIFGIKANANTNWSRVEGSHIYAPYVWLGPHASLGSTTNVELPHSSKLAGFCTQAVHNGPAQTPVYMGFSVNASAGEVSFFCGANGTMRAESVRFNASDSVGTDRWPATAQRSNATLGYKNVPSQTHSSIEGLHAKLGGLALLSDKWLGTRQHAALANVLGKQLDVPAMRSASGWTPNSESSSVALWLSSDSVNAGGVRLLEVFPLPLPTASDAPAVERSRSGEPAVLKLCQNSSASLELPRVSCATTGPGLHLRVRFRLRAASTIHSTPTTQRFTILTLGDGDSHVRLIAVPRSHFADNGSDFALKLFCSTTGPPSTLLSSIELDTWTSVEVNSVAGRVTGVISADVSTQGANNSIRTDAAAAARSMISAGGQPASVNCGCSSEGPIWAFLGEGFLDRPYKYGTDCVEHDVATLHSNPTPCGCH